MLFFFIQRSGFMLTSFMRLVDQAQAERKNFPSNEKYGRATKSALQVSRFDK
jgi:hypothetical protein